MFEFHGVYNRYQRSVAVLDFFAQKVVVDVAAAGVAAAAKKEFAVAAIVEEFVQIQKQHRWFVSLLMKDSHRWLEIIRSSQR